MSCHGCLEIADQQYEHMTKSVSVPDVEVGDLKAVRFAQAPSVFSCSVDKACFLEKLLRVPLLWTFCPLTRLRSVWRVLGPEYFSAIL